GLVLERHRAHAHRPRCGARRRLAVATWRSPCVGRTLADRSLMGRRSSAGRSGVEASAVSGDGGLPPTLPRRDHATLATRTKEHVRLVLEPVAVLHEYDARLVARGFTVDVALPKSRRDRRAVAARRRPVRGERSVPRGTVLRETVRHRLHVIRARPMRAVRPS